MLSSTSSPPTGSGSDSCSDTSAQHKSINGATKKEIGLESQAGWFSRFYFNWLSKTVIRRKGLPPLTLDNIPELPLGDDIKSNTRRLKVHVAKENERCKVLHPDDVDKQYEEFSMTRVAYEFSKPHIWYSVPLKLVYDILNYSLPVLMNRMMVWTRAYDTLTNDSLGTGIGLVIAFAVLTFSQTIFLQQYFHNQNRMGTRLTGALTSLIYEKVLDAANVSYVNKLSPLGNKWNQEGEEVGDGQVLTLVQVDAVTKVTMLMTYVHTVWSAPLQIIIALTELYLMVGAEALVGVPVMMIFVPLTKWSIGLTGKFEQAFMEAVDKRQRASSELMESQRILKMYAWEVIFGDRVIEQRKFELSRLKRSRQVRATLTLLWGMNPVMVSAAVFAIILGVQGRLTAEVAFTSIALFNLLSFPLTMLPSSLAMLKDARISLDRIGKLLNMPSVDSVNQVPYSANKPAIQFLPGFQTKQTFDLAHLDCKPAVRGLKRDHLTVDAGEKLAIVGRVGCGKSSIISAFLGTKRVVPAPKDVVPLGSIYEQDLIDCERSYADAFCFSGKLAIVPQLPWILNTTIRDNVLFGRDMEVLWYKQVLKACELVDDLRVLTDGDMTEIGERGVNLSGGQKQRISIARALYRRADIYLMDDCISALDSHVGKAIMKTLFTDILAKKSVIMVTNALPLVDKYFSRVILLSSEHDVAFNGTPAGLAEIDHNILPADNAEARDIELDGLVRVQQAVRSEVRYIKDDDGIVDARSITHSVLTLSESRSQHHCRASFLSRDESFLAEMVHEQTTVNKVMRDDMISTKGVSMADYLYYCRHLGYGTVVFVTVLFVLYAAFGAVASWIVTVWTEPGTELYQDQWVGYGIYVALQSGGVLLGFIAAFALVKAQLKASTKVHNEVLDRLLRSTMTWFDSTPLGRIQNILGKELYSMDATLPDNIRTSLYMIVRVISNMVMIVVGLPWFAVPLVVIGVVYFWIMFSFFEPARQVKRVGSVANAPVLSQLGASLKGTDAIRIMGEGDRFKSGMNRELDHFLRSSYTQNACFRWLSARLETVSAFITTTAAITVVIGTHLGKITAGSVGLALSYALSSSQMLAWMVRMLTELEVAAVSIERIRACAEVNELDPPRETDFALPKDWPSEGRIVFDNVHFKYKPELPMILKGLSFAIQKKQRVGICGRTGAGKSTVYITLLRLVEITKGTISIDGIDISKLGLHDLRGSVAIIPQDPVIFQGTLRYNIDPIGKKTDAELREIVKRSSLQSFLDNEEGLDFKLEAGGENISAGQRQLMCFCRALVRRAKVLLLDEATSSVDKETDLAIQKMMRTEFTDCTIMTIAHRLETIMEYDRILVLSQGQLIEDGTPHELMNRPGSEFSQMVAAEDI